MTLKPTALLRELAKEPAKRRGRPSHVPNEGTRRQVMQFCAMGLSRRQISKLLAIGEQTMYKYYRPELDTAESQALFQVANNLYNIATDPTNKSSAAAAMFWMKTRGGWREKNRLDELEQQATDKAEGGSTGNQVLDPRLLSLEQRQALREIVTVAAQAMMGKPIDANLIEHDEPEEEEESGEEDEEEMK